MLLEEDLSKNEYKVIIGMLRSIRYDKKEMSFINGNNLNVSYLCKRTKIDKSNMYKILKKLEEREIIKKVEENYLMNPYILSVGVKISKDLKDEFKESKWNIEK